MNAKTAARLEDLRMVEQQDYDNALSDILSGNGLKGFRQPKPNGWAVLAGKEEIAHRQLIAGAIRHSQRRRKVPVANLTPKSFGDAGVEFQDVLATRFGAKIRDLPLGSTRR